MPALTTMLGKALGAAAEHPQGWLPDTVTEKTLAQLRDLGYVPAEPGRPAITLKGRLALLSRPQLNALTTAMSDGRLAPNVAWQTSHRLARWHLVVFKDAAGNSFPDDADTGSGRPVRHAFRTGLGLAVATTAPPRR
ncbi:hypothetical protein OG689_41600 [Kitasatospora sp. NBC_00240]|uniref:hypothetical protein n=1 Tax=Kitasatospora sp. NBC_00240 TaxID=2903567 RepID=UPI00224D6942|nr:hypothetical protein [Kitasatospora sp. NBC_00240]MCX5215653.1 hypothetical protein [Kitasatospora sp. NBC_00240]